MKILFASLFVSLLLPFGVANAQQSLYEDYITNLSQAIKTANLESGVCINSVLTNKNYGKTASKVDSEIISLIPNNPNKIRLMASNAKVTPSQAKLFLTAIPPIKECNDAMVKAYGNYPTIALVYEQLNNELDLVYANLIAQKITIGEANQSYQKLITNSDKDLQASIDALNRSYFDSTRRMQANQDQMQYQANQRYMQEQAIQSSNNALLMGIGASMLQQYSTPQLMAPPQNNFPTRTNCRSYAPGTMNCTSW